MDELNKGYEFTKAQIAELESLRAENTRLDAGWRDSNFCWFKAAKELETLRARLAELEKQKPVATVDSPYIAETDMDLPIGTKLFSSPVVSPDVEKLIADHNSDMAACHEQFMDVSREVMSLKTELEATRNDGGLDKRNIDYPRDVFNSLILGNSPYAFYLFQWVPYQTDAQKWRLKMLHDVKTFDGREAFRIWPNGSSCGPFKDDEVEFIRISKKQFGAEWIDPRKSPEEAIEQAKGGVK